MDFFYAAGLLHKHSPEEWCTIIVASLFLTALCVGIRLSLRVPDAP
jgi:hypothetical protein